jgi:hypothetical protein
MEGAVPVRAGPEDLSAVGAAFEIAAVPQDIVGNKARHVFRCHRLETFIAQEATPEHGARIGLEGKTV